MIRFRFPYIYGCAVLFLVMAAKANGQTDALTPSLKTDSLPLEDLRPFQPIKTKNWLIAGNVSADRHQEKNLDVKHGKGVLVYIPKQKESRPLRTKLEHGDMDLHLDFLLSKSASFTILLQGRYEITITDEWLKNNAVKAPGLWQNLTVRFKAPRIGPNGAKAEDAVIEEMLINGQQVQKSTKYSISGVSSFKEEQEVGPLVFLGRDSPFAIRNIRYKTYKPDKITLTDIGFKVYQGLYKNADTLASLKPKRTGVTDTISHLVGDRKSQLVFDGSADIPADGEYLFQLTAGGGAWLYLDGTLVIDNKGSRDFEKAFYAKKTLKKGKVPFKLIYSNSDECLVLHYEGPNIPWHALTTAASVRLSEKFDPLEYKVKDKPVIQRGFMLNNGSVNPYTAAVGMPGDHAHQGLNYAYDMKNYNLTGVWHGKYIDVSNMWTERGEKQLEIPLGAKLEFSGRPVLSKNPNQGTAWPDSVQAPEGVYSNRGYKLDQDGYPVFYYALDKVSVEDRFYPNQEKSGLTRLLKITNPSETAYCLLAEGQSIEALGDGNYTVDDKKYYISGLDTGALKATISQSGGIDRLIISIPPQKENSTIQFDMIW